MQGNRNFAPKKRVDSNENVTSRYCESRMLFSTNIFFMFEGRLDFIGLCEVYINRFGHGEHFKICSWELLK